MPREYQNVTLPYLGLWRARRKYTQAKLAERAGISREYVSILEHKRKQASLGMVEKLAEALSISTEALQRKPPKTEK